MATEEEIKDRLKSEGYTQIIEYKDPANEIFADHDHPGDELLIVVSGSIAISMGGKEHNLAAGDELFFPAKQTHSATIGPEGCFYIVGEKE